MSRFDLKVKVSLAGLADGWTDEHYMTFKPFDVDESLDSSDEMNKLKDEDLRGLTAVFKSSATKQFVEGKVVVDGKTVDAIAEDVASLPAPVITQIFTTISRSDFSNPKA
ncbi:hypothetical protein [Rhodococcus erythropolis]